MGINKNIPLFHPGSRKAQRNRYPIDLKRRHLYQYYKYTFKYEAFQTRYSKNTKLIVDSALYSKIVNDMFEMIACQILDKSRQFKLPCNLGYIGIKKKKMDFQALKELNVLFLDYTESKKLGRKIFHVNDHSNNYRYRWFWDKRGCKIPFKSAYKFIAHRDNKRKLAFNIKNKVTDYSEENLKFRPKYRRQNDSSKTDLQ